jgi:hypothetical protein
LLETIRLKIICLCATNSFKLAMDSRLFGERAYQHLLDNYGDLARPAVIVVSTQPLEACNAVQAVFDGSVPGYVIANYVTVGNSGAVQKWQLLLLSPQHVCSPASGNNACPVNVPQCSSLGVCAQFYDSTRLGLTSALQSVASSLSPSSTIPLYAALAETVRTSDGRYQCVGIDATTRNLRNDARLNNSSTASTTAPLSQIPAFGSAAAAATTPGITTAIAALPQQTSSAQTSAPTSATVDDGGLQQGQITTSGDPASFAAGVAAANIAEERRNANNWQWIVFISVIVLLIIIAIIAIAIAASQSGAKDRKERAEQQHLEQVDSLYRDSVERRIASETAAALASRGLF